MSGSKKYKNSWKEEWNEFLIKYASENDPPDWTECARQMLEKLEIKKTRQYMLNFYVCTRSFVN